MTKRNSCDKKFSRYSTIEKKSKINFKMSDVFKICFGGTVLDGYADESYAFKFVREYYDDFGRFKEEIFSRKPELRHQSVKLLYKGEFCFKGFAFYGLLTINWRFCIQKSLQFLR